MCASRRGNENLTAPRNSGQGLFQEQEKAHRAAQEALCRKARFLRLFSLAAQAIT